MSEILATVADILQTAEDLVLLKVISNSGSTPRTSGARMVVHRNGATDGTIGGGLVEALALRKATEAFENKHSIIFGIDLAGNDVAGTEMICGGRMELLCEYLASEEETRRAFEAIKEEYRNFRKHYLCTEIVDQEAGLKTVNRFILGRDGIHGQESDQSAFAERIMEMNRSLVGSAIVSVDGKKYCIDVIESEEALFIFGAGHVAREVAQLGANVGFHVIVLDDRSDFANALRFPNPIDVKVIESFDGCFDNLSIDRDSYLVILTRGHAHDKNVLEQALRTNAGYIGMISSVKKRDTIYRVLLSEGFTTEDLQKVHSPIGMPIDSETPEEIAVSIVGELIHVRSQKRIWKRRK